MKQGFKRAIACNKYRSDITTQPENKNFDCVIDPTFRNINRLFLISFKNEDDDDFSRNSFNDYYMTLFEIKGFNGLIHNKPFFDQPRKKQTRSV